MRFPILLNFDSTQEVGYAEIDPTVLPKDPNWVLSLEVVMSKTIQKDYCSKQGLIGEYELKSFSIVPDQNYSKYLQTIGCY